MRAKPKRVRWRKRALDDLQGLHEWLGKLPRAKPRATIARIRAAAESLARLGDIGRPSIAEGVRELSVRGAPYVIVYRIEGETVDILAVYHTAQDR
ncbi:MAG: type II toxin-antitoxin system RelE/ParE family toxin [Alphaproteobacteria bacterium]|nr:type II toxin-antitoxin system RelE/ParE family toxin [Alphaproteobacteria bacterium]